MAGRSVRLGHRLLRVVALARSEVRGIGHRPYREDITAIHHRRQGSLLKYGQPRQDLEIRANIMVTEQFDYIIVGAGSAGCVLANRLTEDPAVRVLVLEFGGSDRSINIQMASAFSMPMNTAKYNWRYQTAPEAHLNGRQLHCPRGKV